MESVKKQRTWTDEDMQTALEIVERTGDTKNITKVAKQFNIPRSTLAGRITPRRGQKNDNESSVKVTRKRQGEPQPNWPTPPQPAPPPPTFRTPPNTTSAAGNSLHSIQYNYGNSSSEEDDEDQYGDAYGQEEEYYNPEEHYSGDDYEETGEVHEKPGVGQWSKQEYEEDSGRHKGEGIEAENALRQLSVNSSIQVNRVPGNKPEAPPQKNILDASHLQQYLSQVRGAENKGKKADFPRNVSPSQHKKSHVPLNQPHHGPTNQPYHGSANQPHQQAHHGSANQSHHGSANQSHYGSANQPYHGSANQSQHSSASQSHHGSANQPHHGSVNQPQHSPVNQPRQPHQGPMNQHHSSMNQGPVNQPHHSPLPQPTSRALSVSKKTVQPAPPVSKVSTAPSGGMPRPSPTKSPVYAKHSRGKPQQTFLPTRGRGEIMRPRIPVGVSHSRRSKGFRPPTPGRSPRMMGSPRLPAPHPRQPPYFRGAPPRPTRPQGPHMQEAFPFRGRAANRRRPVPRIHSPITKIPKSITVSKAHGQQQHEPPKVKDVEQPPYIEEDEYDDEEGAFYDEEYDGGWFEDDEEYSGKHYGRMPYRPYRQMQNVRGRVPSQFTEYPGGYYYEGMGEDEEVEEEEEEYDEAYEGMPKSEMVEPGFPRKEHMDKGEPSAKGHHQEQIPFLKDSYDEDSLEGYADYPEEGDEEYEDFESDPENSGEMEGEKCPENKLPYLRGVTVSVMQRQEQPREKGMPSGAPKQRIVQEGKFSQEVEPKNYQDFRKQQMGSPVGRWRDSVSARLQRRSPRGRMGMRFPSPRMNHPQLPPPQAQDIPPVKFSSEKDSRPPMVMQQLQMTGNDGGMKKDNRILPRQGGNNSVIMIINQDSRGFNNPPLEINPQTVIMMKQAANNAARPSATIKELPPEDDEVHDAPEAEEKRKGAFCKHCGFISENFTRCTRCNQKLPDNVKIIELPLSFPMDAKSPHVIAGRNTRALTKKQKQQQDEEPECYTLSSDEEENSPTSDQSPQEGEHDNAMGESTEDQTAVAEFKELLMKIEKGSLAPPFTLMDCVSVRVGNYKGIPRDQVILTDLNFHVCLPPVDELNPQEGRTVIMKIPNDEIIEVKAHLRPDMPVLFLTLDPAAAKQIRSTLRMVEKCTDKPRIYYDPASSDKREMFITIILDSLSNENALAIRQIFNKPPPAEKGSGQLLTEIELDMANTLLKSSAPVEVERRDTVIANRTFQDGEAQTLLVWPPRPYKDGITINTDDYGCLEEEQFLNDVIIDFYLKFLLLERLSEEDRGRTHMFSSYFYRRLTTKPKRMRRSHPIEDDPNLTPAQKRHARVKSWTKNVDIFEKDFIVIPINEHAHWFLAIICFPYLEGPVTMEGNVPITDPKLLKNPPKSRRKPKLSDAAEMKPIQIGSTTIVPVNQTILKAELLDPELSDRDEAEGDSSEMEDEDEEQPIPPPDELEKLTETEENKEPDGDEATEDDKKEESAESNSEEAVSSTVPSETTATSSNSTTTTSTVTTNTSAVTSTTTAVTVTTNIPLPLPPSEPPPKPEPRKCPSPPPTYEPIKMPCILIFDSLAGPGANRYRTVATLRDYLTVEWEAKKGTARKFTRDNIKGATPKVPQQTNFSDCGIYLLQYAESFFRDPLKDYRIPIRTLQEWFTIGEAAFKRQTICDLIKDFVNQHNPSNLDKIPMLKMFGDEDELDEEEELEEEEEEYDDELPPSPPQEAMDALPPPQPPLPQPQLPVSPPKKRETENECEEKEPKRLKMSQEDDDR